VQDLLGDVAAPHAALEERKEPTAVRQQHLEHRRRESHGHEHYPR
jgi:hypothetical protein